MAKDLPPPSVIHSPEGEKKIKIGLKKFKANNMKEQLEEVLRLHKMWLKTKKEGERANLIGANLEEADLRGANFEGADLRGANLRKADLRGANLEEANLRGAILRKADLRGANLEEANLIGAYLEGANLIGANLIGANLYRANLRGAKLKGANLEGANLIGANLIGANLYRANLIGANLPISCKWQVSIIKDKIQIGCEKRTIKEWDKFFASDEVIETERDTEDFKRIEAMYLAYKAYYEHLNK